MRMSETLDKIIPALLDAQKGISAIKKEGEADAGKFSYTYAELSDVVSEVKSKLNEKGMVILQPVDSEVVTTKIIHTSGQWISDEGVRIINGQPNDPQAQGKAITYARRYGLLSLLCLETEDDDGKGAMPTTEPTKRATSHLEETKLPGKSKQCVECGGEAIMKSGMGKSGKPWRGYFCGECKHVEWIETETLTF